MEHSGSIVSTSPFGIFVAHLHEKVMRSDVMELVVCRTDDTLNWSLDTQRMSITCRTAGLKLKAVLSTYSVESD